MRFRKRNRVLEMAQWNQLATYNAERARGLVHTPEWREKMVEEQERYGRWIRDQSPVWR